MPKWILGLGILFCPMGAWSATVPESQCFGLPADGYLEEGWSLPDSGSNFRVYSTLGWFFGRTYVHSRVQRAILRAYVELENTNPELRFVYGETGKREGGSFWPHVTHQNGLSVDFMVPVVDEKGRPSEFPGSWANRFGYDLEFDSRGRWRQYRIDFEAMSEHLFQLHRAARKEGIGIRLVIFAPELSQELFKTRRGKYLARQVRFYRRPARLRHDEHYHVDFHVRCSKERR